MSNSKDKVLIISPFFFPEPISTGKFNTHFVNALKRKVQSVTVLCSHPFYPEWKVTPSTDSLKEVTIIRGGKRIIYPKNTTLRRFILELWYAFFVFFKFLKLRNKVDVIVPIFPPSLAFYILQPFLRKEQRSIAIIHDLQEVYASKKRGFLNKIISFFINKIEGSALRSCDKVIFLSTEMKNTAQEYYRLDTTKLAVHYPFVTLDLQGKTEDLNAIFSKDIQHIVYSGALGEKQNPEKLYAFFNYSSSKIEATLFHIFSSGAVYESLKRKNKNKKIKFHNLVAERNIKELYQKSTVQIIPQKEGTSKGSLPSKLPNILFANRKVLVITDKNSELDIIFKKNNLNTVVTLWDNQVLCTALVNLLNNREPITNKKVVPTLFSIKSMIDLVLRK